MQDDPNLQDILKAVARFLEEEVRPALADPKLAYRARIAAHLCTTSARESAREEAEDAAQVARLNAFFADDPAHTPPTREGRRARIEALTARLVERIKEGQLTTGERSYITRHVKDSLKERLEVNSPGFDFGRSIDHEPEPERASQGKMSK
jgi:hypothetical protein